MKINKTFIERGRYDFFSGNMNIDHLINSEKDKEKLLELLSNYLIGWKLAVLEVSYKNNGMEAHFDEEKCRIYCLDRCLTNDEIFEVIEEKSEEMAKHLVEKK